MQFTGTQKRATAFFLFEWGQVGTGDFHRVRQDVAGGWSWSGVREKILLFDWWLESGIGVV